ncbi:acyltransferase family protein [Haliea sp.]
MFGIYRTALALLVVLQHLGEVPSIGTYAVFGFYVLSGYLMTAIMHQNYGFSLGGIFKYAVNRGLRIYPIYWVACLLTLGLIVVFGSTEVSNFHSAMRYPTTANEIIKNIFIIFPDLSSARLSPPAWALTVELFFYALIGLGLSKYFFVTVIWFVCSLVYHVTALSPQFPWSDTYFSIAAASLPFSTGALIYFQRARFESFVKRNQTGILAVLVLSFALNFLLFRDIVSKEFAFYFSYVICSLLVLALSFLNTSSSGRKADKWIGDLSYPIYLIHYQVGFLCLVAFQYFDFVDEVSSAAQLAAITLATIAVSRVVVALLQSPIDGVRDLVRDSGFSKTDSRHEVVKR